MKLFMLIAIVGAVASMVMYRRSRQPGLVTAAKILAVVAIVLGVWSIFTSGKEAVPAKVAEHMSVGDRLGQEMEDLLPDGGKVLLIHYTSGLVLDPYPMMESALRGVKRALRRTNLEVIEQSLTPEIGEMWERCYAGTGVMDRELLTAYLKTFPDADLVVSMMGLPDCAPSDVPQPLPPFVVWGDPEDAENDAWTSSGAMKVLVAARPQATGSSFEDRYEITRF